MTIERPGLTFVLEYTVPCGPLMQADESLARFRTVAFGIEVMREYIGRKLDTITLGVWWDLIPEAYITQLWPLIDVVAKKHVGRKLTEELLRQFVDDLNREIGAQLQPRLVEL